ncbi:hypothetical protein Thermo_01673 [Thermoplasmatales archaeon]|nr:hypothetical protein Thermo_01673 [Thermoplasmatales archaeon]
MDRTITTQKIYEDSMDTIKNSSRNRGSFAEALEGYVSTCEKIREDMEGSVKVPEFLMRGEVSNSELYKYLKVNPKASKFIFRKYTQNRQFIQEICDPDNPLFLPKVQEELKISVEIGNMEDQVKELSMSIQGKQNERNSLIETITDLQKENDDLEAKNKTMKQESGILENQLLNLHSSEGIQKVNAYLTQVQTFIRRVYEDKDNQDPTRLSGMKGMFSLDKEKFHALLVDAEKLGLYMETDRFKQESIETSKSELIKLKEQIETEKAQVETELKAILYLKPSKKLVKVNEGMQDMLNTVYRISRVNSGQQSVRIEWIGFNGIRENLQEAQKTVGDLYQQIQRVEQ